MAKGEVEKVTQADVDAAEARLVDSRNRAEELHHAYITDSADASWEDYRSAAADLERAEADVLRAVVRKRQYDEEVLRAGIIALRDEVLRDAPENGINLLAVLKPWWDLTTKIAGVCDAQSAWVNSVVQRARDLGIPDKGVASPDHAGLATSAGGDILVDDMIVRPLDAKQLFSLFFEHLQNGALLPTADQTRIDHAFAVASSYGKEGK